MSGKVVSFPDLTVMTVIHECARRSSEPCPTIGRIAERIRDEDIKHLEPKNSQGVFRSKKRRDSEEVVGEGLLFLLSSGKPLRDRPRDLSILLVET